MIFRSTIITTALLMATATTPAAATSYNTIHLQAKGCPNCEVHVGGLVERRGKWKWYGQTTSLYQGIGTVRVPRRFTTVGFEVTDPKHETGWNSTTTIALRYRGFQPGDRVSKRQSRTSKWAQDCLSVTQPETWIRFRVVKDRNPRKYKKHDSTWTRYSLRAWATPQIAGDGLFREAWRGRTSTQNPNCGYTP